MTISAYFSAFGYHNRHSAESAGLSLNCSNFNRGNLIGYVPIAGLWTAYLRISKLNPLPNIFAPDSINKKKEKPLGYNAAIVTRAVMEGLGLGLLLAIPDIIMSIGRAISGSYLSKKTEPVLTKIETLS